MSENVSNQISNHKRHQRLKEKSRKAFQKWLRASNEWVLARHRVQRGGGDTANEVAKRKVQKLEKRLDEAAEAYEEAREKVIQISN